MVSQTRSVAIDGGRTYDAHRKRRAQLDSVSRTSLNQAVLACSILPSREGKAAVRITNRFGFEVLDRGKLGFEPSPA